MPSIIRATTTSGLQVAPDNSGSLQLQTNGTTTAVTIDTSQNVGIGTTSPAFANSRNGLVVKGNTTNGGEVIVQTSVDTGSTGLAIAKSGVEASLFNRSNGLLSFGTNNTERMRIDSSGYVTKPFQPAFSVGGTNGGNKTAGTAFGFTDATGGSAQITYNISGSWSNANNRFTAPVAGIYLFNAAIYVQNATTAIQSIAPRLNGAQLSTGDSFILFSGLVATGNTDNQVTGTFTMKLAAADYVDIAVRSGAPTIAYYAGHSFFQGYLLG